MTNISLLPYNTHLFSIFQCFIKEFPIDSQTCVSKRIGRSILERERRIPLFFSDKSCFQRKPQQLPSGGEADHVPVQFLSLETAPSSPVGSDWLLRLARLTRLRDIDRKAERL